MCECFEFPGEGISKYAVNIFVLSKFKQNLMDRY